MNAACFNIAVLKKEGRETQETRLKCKLAIVYNEEMYTTDISMLTPSLISKSINETLNFYFIKFYIVYRRYNIQIFFLFFYKSCILC